MTPTIRTLACFAASLVFLAALLGGMILLTTGSAEAEEAADTAYRQAVDVARATDRG